jgi:glutamyl-tRNA synthetase
MENIKVRIAPSPTGNLHIGTARTALFNWLFAKKNKGEFILRIEDTDLERSRLEYELNIIEGLKWLGLNWDNDKIIRQSERLDKYEFYLKNLLDSGKAFWCHHSKEELEFERKNQEKNKIPPRHICEHKNTNLGKQKGQIIRLSVDENSSRIIRFQDKIRGTIEWEEKLIGDLSLAKDLRIPLYNFAAVVDDIDMKISHVIRGEDHISNTPKQILIYESIGQNPPIFAHLPLILNYDKSKLSKRQNAVSIDDYKKDYLPEAIVNFIGFLGYTYSKEIITKEEMVKEFDLEKVHKSGAIFNIEKLNWINSRYIKQLSATDFKKLISIDIPEKAIPIITERLEKITDIKNFNYFWEEPSYDSNLLLWKHFSREEVRNSLIRVKELIENFDWNNIDTNFFHFALDDLSKKFGDRGLVYWPFRVSLTGREKSPDPVDVAMVLNKIIVLDRIENAIKRLEN